MFDWFRTRRNYEMPKIPVMPVIEPPKEKEQEQEYYSIGVTSEGKMTFKTGITTLTMSRKGCEDLIEQLTVFKNQLPESNND